MGVNDTLTVSDSGLTVFGASGIETVSINAGVTQVTLDQLIERINFPNAGGSYTFKQTGNKINVYDSTGTSLLANAPVQGDADGTVLSFAGQTHSAILQAGGVMKLGAFTVSAGTPTALLASALALSNISLTDESPTVQITLMGLTTAHDNGLPGMSGL